MRKQGHSMLREDPRLREFMRTTVAAVLKAVEEGGKRTTVEGDENYRTHGGQLVRECQTANALFMAKQRGSMDGSG